MYVNIKQADNVNPHLKDNTFFHPLKNISAMWLLFSYFEQKSDKGQHKLSTFLKQI